MWESACWRVCTVSLAHVFYMDTKSGTDPYIRTRDDDTLKWWICVGSLKVLLYFCFNVEWQQCFENYFSILSISLSLSPSLCLCVYFIFANGIVKYANISGGVLVVVMVENFKRKQFSRFYFYFQHDGGFRNKSIIQQLEMTNRQMM